MNIAKIKKHIREELNVKNSLLNINLKKTVLCSIRIMKNHDLSEEEIYAMLHTKFSLTDSEIQEYLTLDDN